MQFQENPSNGSQDTAEKVIGPQSKEPYLNLHWF